MLIFASPEAKARFRSARKKASCGGGTETLVFYIILKISLLKT